MNLFGLKQLLLLLLLLGCNGCSDDETHKRSEELQQAITSDLQIGTSKVEVSEYLEREGIEYSYTEQDKIFYAIVPKIGKFRIVYDASLLMKIKLNDDELLESIVFDIEYSGL